MAAINFTAKLFTIDSWIIFKLPERDSELLPSRGMIMVAGTLQSVPFKAMLESDGKYEPSKTPSHFFSTDKSLLDKANVGA